MIHPDSLEVIRGHQTTARTLTERPSTLAALFEAELAYSAALSMLAAENVESTEELELQFNCHVALADILAFLGSEYEALQHRQKSLLIARTLADKDPTQYPRVFDEVCQVAELYRGHRFMLALAEDGKTLVVVLAAGMMEGIRRHSFQTGVRLPRNPYKTPGWHLRSLPMLKEMYDLLLCEPNLQGKALPLRLARIQFLIGDAYRNGEQPEAAIRPYDDAERLYVDLHRYNPIYDAEIKEAREGLHLTQNHQLISAFTLPTSVFDFDVLSTSTEPVLVFDSGTMLRPARRSH